MTTFLEFIADNSGPSIVILKRREIIKPVMEPCLNLFHLTAQLKLFLLEVCPLEKDDGFS